MNKTLQALLDERRPGKRGIHGSANIYTPADEYQQQFAGWRACRFSWLKLLASGDSQVETVRRMRDAQLDIIPVIRFYLTNCPANTVAPDLLRLYRDVGVVIFESQYNEFYFPFENSWGQTLGSGVMASVARVFGVSQAVAAPIGGTRPGEIKRSNLARLVYGGPSATQTAGMGPAVSPMGMPSDWAVQVAHGWSLFAEAVLSVGGVPSTPSIETWHYDDVMVPLFEVLAQRHRGLLEQSIVAMHNRPLNHPIAYAEDPGCYRGWEWVDRLVKGLLGHELPMMAMEANTEVGWDQDKRYPRVTPDIHAQMTMEMWHYPTPPYYLADCSWLWEDLFTFAPASWKRNFTYMSGADLPAVRAMELSNVPLPPVVPDDRWPVGDVEWRARRKCFDNLYPEGGIPWNPGAAFQQYGDHGAPVTVELFEGGYAMQGFALAFGWCLDGQWGKIQWSPWTK